ncbi:MAG: hypothetical protein KF836_09530 [Fimbriimonadaceae bacterium]|nr:hypothetical protein [Fimbriimonadaceae bacterium]
MAGFFCIANCEVPLQKGLQADLNSEASRSRLGLETVLSEDSDARKILKILEETPSWNYGLRSLSGQPAGLMSEKELAKEWELVIANSKKISKFSNEAIARAILLFCRRHSYSEYGDLEMFGAKNPILLVVRFLFLAPDVEAEDTPFFWGMARNDKGQVRRLWPLSVKGNKFTLLSESYFLSGFHSYDAIGEFAYYSKHYERRQLVPKCACSGLDWN